MRSSRVSLLILAAVLVTAVPAWAHWDLKGYEFVVVLDDDRMDIAIDDHDRRHIDRLRAKYSEPFVWVGRGDSEWVITDPEITEQIRDMLEAPPELKEMSLDIEIESEEIEKSMEVFERRIERLERDLDDMPLRAALEIAKAARDLEVDRLTEAATRLELHADGLETWVNVMRERLEDEAILLIEGAIRTGKAERLR